MANRRRRIETEVVPDFGTHFDFGKDLELVSKVFVYLRNTYSHCIPSLNESLALLQPLSVSITK